MATPRIDRIVTAFCDRIGDPATFSTGALQGGNVITTAAAIMSYINRAMLELFRSRWEAVRGDKQKFIEIFPELLKVRTVNFTYSSPPANTSYVIANPNLDYLTIVDATYGSTYYFTVFPATEYNTIRFGRHEHRTPTESNPGIIDSQRTLYMFPTGINSAGGLTGVNISIIVLPLDPTTGGLLAQNGSYDSPYYDHWNDEIVRIAEELYQKDRQNRR
jgi:hypothetical protein